MGYQSTDELVITVQRGGVEIGRASGTAMATPEGLGLEVNHGPAGLAPEPGECWQDVTPDIRGGDVVRVTTVNRPAGTQFLDEYVVADLAFTVPAAQLDSVTGEVFVEGVAATAEGGQFPSEAVGVEFRYDDVTPRFRRGPFEAVYTDDTSTTWRATYDPAADTHEVLDEDGRRQAARDDASWSAVIGNLAETETTIAELGEPGGPALGCEGSPADPNALTGGYAEPVNIASGDIVLAGTAAADVQAVTVTVGGLGERSATPLGGTPEAPDSTTWSLLVSKADLLTLADGSITLTPGFDGVPGTPRQMLKDTVAPAAPTATPPAGTYTTAQSVNMVRPAGEEQSRLFWNIGNGTQADPTTTSTPYASAISVSATQTIKARLVDAAGNPGAVGTFAYTIDTATGGGTGGGGGTPPPSGGGTVGGGGTPPPSGGGTVGGGGTPPPPPLEPESSSRTLILRPVADTSVFQHKPAATNGDADRAAVDRRATDRRGSRVTSFLKFRVPALADGERIASAGLSLWAVNGTPDGPQVWRTRARWGESTMTWGSRPARVGASPRGDFAAVGVGWASTKLTGVTPGGMFSVELFAESSNMMSFTTRDSAMKARRPRLVLTITTP
ncbi:MAG: DNRLRE domain-containing protein [Actinomycetes bacterium]